MKRNLTYPFVVFILLACWILFGALTQLLMGVLKWSELPFVFGVAIGVSAVLTLIFYFIFAISREKFGSKKDSESEYKPSRKFLNVAVFLVAVVSVTSIVQSYSIGKEKNDIAENQEKAANKQKLATIARAESEKQRLASMTPEQRAAAGVQKQEEIAAAAKAAAQKEAAEKQKIADTKKRALQLQLAAAGALTLKNAMKDPEAFELKSLVVKPNGAACYDYRAKNGFGATFPDSAILTKEGKLLTHERNGNTFVGAWNRDCTPSGGDDITTIVNRIMSSR